MMAAVASGFVGFVALATSTYNVYLQRQQVRAQVLPRLVFDPSLTKGNGFSLTVTNRGVGPAEIKRLRVLVDRQPAVDWWDALKRVDPTLEMSDLSGLSPLGGQMLSPGLEIKALRFDDFAVGSRFISTKKKLDVELCYCSTLDECWVVGSDDGSNRSVGDCAPDPKPFAMLTEEHMAALLAVLASDAGTPTKNAASDGGAHDGG
jgi:hypothetical protein